MVVMELVRYDRKERCMMADEVFTAIEYIRPMEIEARSMEIISQELAERGESLDPEQAPTVMRCIHTSADFDYARTLQFSANAVEKGVSLLETGATIVTDTNMALAGINKRALANCRARAVCFMADPRIAAEAKKRGVTRAAVSMEAASHLAGPVMLVVGNAPTALLSVYDMIRSGSWIPDFVIGVPVGFVNVVASKERIMSTSVPYVVNAGRKGGSNVAAAIVNSLLYQIEGSRL